MKIREVVAADAAQMMELHKQLDTETKFMLYEPNEREINVPKQESTIHTFIRLENSNIFVVEDQNKLVGHLTVIGGRNIRIKHRAHIVIGLLNEYTGIGIGKQLFDALEDWRQKSMITRLELTVMAHNENGIKLYKSMGFEIEGVKKNSIILDGQYIDEYCMAKIY